MSCQIDGCFGECETHSPKRSASGLANLLYNTKPFWEGQTYSSYAGSEVGSPIDALSVATKKYIAHSLFAYKVEFTGWKPSMFSKEIEGCLWTGVGTLESICGAKATYIPMFVSHQIMLDMEDLEIISKKPIGIFGLIQQKIESGYKNLLLSIEELTVQTNAKFPDLQGLASVIPWTTPGAKYQINVPYYISNDVLNAK